MNRHILCAFLCALIAPAAEGTSTLTVYATNSSDCVLTNVHAVNVTTDDCGSSTIHTFDGDIPAHSKVSVLSVLFGGFGCSAHGAHGLISSPDQFSYSWSLGPSEGRVDVFEVAGDSCSVTNTQDPNNGDDPCRETGCQSCPGMPVWRVAEPYTTLWINDEPLGYKPAAGPPISFRLAFKQRDQIAGFDTNVFGTGKKWGLSWLSYVSLDSSGSNVVYFSGGRQRKFLGTNDYLTDATLTGNTTSGFTLNYPSGAKTVYGLVVTNTLGQMGSDTTPPIA